ncbi:hypothetical protein [Parasitella parasitica]|uniref:Uncharacterized protein n=1 Tax=Parasitella parasitica TaxID=35722 RepID=A0A0B7MV53_9FUNG|nr:hypothetical protein [Parasitella parasitica]
MYLSKVVQKNASQQVNIAKAKPNQMPPKFGRDTFAYRDKVQKLVLPNLDMIDLLERRYKLLRYSNETVIASE